MKYYDKNKEISYLKYWDVNNLHSWAMLQQHRVSNFVWIEDTSQFNEDFIKNYNEQRRHDKTEYFIHARSLKHPLNLGSVLRKAHRVIKFNLNTWLKPYIDINTDILENTKNGNEKDFFELMNNHG